MAVDEPAGDGQAEPDAAPPWSCRRGAGTAGRSAPARPAGCRARGRRRAGRRGRPTAPGLDAHRRPPWRRGRRRCRRGWRRPARAAPGRPAPRGSVSGTSTHDVAAARSPRLASAAGTTSSSADRPDAARCSAPAWMRLMSSRLSTRSVEPVGLVLDGRRGTRRAPRATRSTSRWRRLLTDALIDASGVRRSCDTACSSAVAQLVGLGQLGGLGGLAVEAPRLDGGGELRGERVEHPPVVVGERDRPDTASTRSSPSSSTMSASSGVVGAVARRGLDAPAAVARVASSADAAQAEGRAQVAATRVGQRVGLGSAPASAARVSASARPVRRLGGTRPAAVDEDADRCRDDRGRRPGRGRSRPRRSSACGRRGEVPVGGEEAGDRGGERRAAPPTADGRDRRQQQVEQQHASGGRRRRGAGRARA